MHPPNTRHIPISESVTDQAFHGTSSNVAESILKDGWKKSTGAHQMLGDGVYFFEGSRAMASAWARDRKLPPPLSVIKSTVKYGRRLNLNDDEAQKLVGIMKNYLSQKMGNAKVSFVVAVSALAEKGEFDTIVAYRRRKDVQPLMESRIDKGIEHLLCVRTLGNIVLSEIVQTNSP